MNYKYGEPAGIAAALKHRRHIRQAKSAMAAGGQNYRNILHGRRFPQVFLMRE